MPEPKIKHKRRSGMLTMCGLMAYWASNRRPDEVKCARSWQDVSCVNCRRSRDGPPVSQIAHFRRDTKPYLLDGEPMTSNEIIEKAEGMMGAAEAILVLRHHGSIVSIRGEKNAKR